MWQFTHRAFLWAALSLAAAWIVPVSAVAQVTPGASVSATASAPRLSAAEMEKLVGPIALYPDDLLAILLPASTTPIEIVKAQRFLEKRKSNPKLQPEPSLTEPVRNLLNYPDVVKKMSDDLDWTERLGQAVVGRQKDVINAIQAFRRKVYAAGNLKTDDKQIIVVEKEVIKVVPANPKVIYVPQYQPTVVVVAQPVPAVVYYPTPYPVYYYGASTAYVVGWSSYAIYGGYNVEKLQEERMDYARESREDWQEHRKEMQGQRQEGTSERQSQRQEAAGGAQTKREQAQPQQSAATSQGQGRQEAGAGQQSGQPWSPQKQAGQVASTQGTRPGDSQFSRGDAGGAFGGSGSSASMASASQRGFQSRSGGGGWSGGGGGFGGRGGGGGRRR